MSLLDVVADLLGRYLGWWSLDRWIQRADLTVTDIVLRCSIAVAVFTVVAWMLVHFA